LKTFFVLWLSQAVSLLGSALVEFALAWYLTLETGSATILATAMLMALVPQIVLGPIIGPLVDRWNRKRIMIIADTAIALVTIGLVVLFAAGAIQVWHVYLAMVARSIGQSFHFPAMLASIPLIVPEKHLSRAAGLNQMLQGAVTIAAPPAGAFLIGLLPMYSVLAVDIATAVVAVTVLFFIAIPQPELTTRTVDSSPFKDMVDGFKYIFASPGLLALTALCSVIVFFIVPAFTLMPILVTGHLGGDVLKLGWLNSAFGIGMIAGGLLLGVWAGFKKRIVTSLVGSLVMSAAAFFLGFTSLSLYPYILAASFIVGAGMSALNAPMMAIIQSVVAKDMQGRFFSIFNALTSALTPLGLAVAGPVADAVGIRPLYFITGAATFLAVVVFFFIPALMNIEAAFAAGKPKAGPVTSVK
jgi:MFS transporter, DHA3 family, macrolide efflux protein